MVENEEILEEKIKILNNAIFHLEKNYFQKDYIKSLINEREKIKNKLPNKIKRVETITNLINHSESIKSEIYWLYIMKSDFFKRWKSGLLKYNINAEDSRGILTDIMISLYNSLIKDELIILKGILPKKLEKSRLEYYLRQIAYYTVYEFLLCLLAKKQFHLTLNIFKKHNKFIDNYKPIYYLTMDYLKDEYPNEYLKAGEELRETIEELKVRINQFEKKLG